MEREGEKVSGKFSWKEQIFVLALVRRVFRSEVRDAPGYDRCDEVTLARDDKRMSSSDAECKIHHFPSKPPTPKCRRSIKSEGNPNLNNFQRSYMAGKRSRQNTSNQSDGSPENQDQRSNYDRNQMTESSSEEDETQSFSPESYKHSKPKSKQDTEIKQNTSYSFFSIGSIIVVVIIGILFYWPVLLALNKNEVQTPSVSDPKQLLSESIKSIKTMFHNQESDIWNDISCAINEVISRIPKIPSIILLFANETATMDCLATKLAHASSIILHAEEHLVFNPKDFGDDAGEIITTLNEHSPEEKKVVMIRDILNINAEAIKALHNLCDRINPLIAEAIFILTMQTNNSQSQQKKLQFVENQIFNKLSKSIDKDILMALITRVTDGVIISVQPEPQIRYC